MPTLTPMPFDGTYFEVLRDDLQGVFVVRRTAHKPKSLEEVRDAFKRLDEVIAREHLHTYGLLVDLRSAPISLDDSHATVQGDLFGKLRARFRASAAVTQTAVGRLQVQRGARAQATDMLVTTQEAEAFAYLARKP